MKYIPTLVLALSRNDDGTAEYRKPDIGTYQYQCQAGVLGLAIISSKSHVSASRRKIFPWDVARVMTRLQGAKGAVSVIEPGPPSVRAQMMSKMRTRSRPRIRQATAITGAIEGRMIARSTRR